MTTLPTIGLLAAMVMAAQPTDDMPEAWKQKSDAAEKARESGDDSRAEALLVEVVREAEKLGDQDLRLATPLEKLACFYLYRLRKRYAAAEPLLRRALAIREKAQGTDHPDVAGTLYDLAGCLLCAGGKDAEAAGPMLERALAIYEKRSRDDPGVAQTLQLLAARHMFRREYDAAESKYMRALAIEEKVSGRDSAKVAGLLEELGTLHTVRAGEWRPPDFDPDNPKAWNERDPEWYSRKAEGFYMRALAIREKTLKPDDVHIADLVFELGQLAVVRERLAEGVPFFSRWLAWHEARKAPPTRKLAEVYNFFSRAAQGRKDWAAAEQYLAKAQATLETLNGAPNEDVGAILYARADVALQARRFDDAERFIKQALDIQAALLGREDPDVLQARTLMAGSYRDHVDDRRAPVLEHRLKVFGDEVSRQRKKLALDHILSEYAELLCQTSRVMPPPTTEDLEYLGKLFDGGSPGGIYWFPQFTIKGEKIDDEALAHVGHLYDLEHLDLKGRGDGRHRPVTDAGLAHIKDLINLRRLTLRGTAITDAGLAHLTGLENLEELDLELTRVGDAGLVHLKGLKSLRTLRLSSTNISDAGLVHLEAIPNLEGVNIHSTKVTQAGVKRLREARPGLDIYD
jgi:tetratricopeptide (TPR) repeat protein